LYEEGIFFGFFWVIFFAGWVLRGYYESKSPDSKKSLSELKRQPLQNESRESFALLSLFGLVMLVAIIVYAFYTSLFPWMQLPLIPILRWLGVIVGMVCLPFIAWIQRTLGESFSKTLTIHEDHKLVTTGPYSRVRHPIYTIFTFWFLSWVLITTNLLFVIMLVLWLAYVFIRIPQEEKMLIEQFGDEYKEYMKSTGRLLPHL
jgi:protein-S-isoprenylcysteine O-methyltransferase Ste14